MSSIRFDSEKFRFNGSTVLRDTVSYAILRVHFLALQW